MLTRRDFIVGATLAPAVSVATPAISALSIGEATLTTVSDGNLVLPGSFIFEGQPEAEVASVLKEFNLKPGTLEPECNLALYQDGTNNVLFDVGSGPDFMPSAGSVLDSLDAVGLAAEDITHVVFTHAHPDHIWGLLDDFDDPTFYEATYMMGRKEWDYWWNPKTVDTIGTARTTFAVGAKRRMEVIEDQIELIDDNQEILPGILAVETLGHTPGHMAFQVGNGALVCGDALGNHHVAFAKPDWAVNSDQDQTQAAATRRILLDRIVQDDLKLVGFHLPGGGIGRVERRGGAYRFVGENS